MDSLDSLDQYDPRLRHAGQVDDAVHRWGRVWGVLVG